jgi:cellulose synthase/poly-beta-1,6-N-acetylglucosamine synthase-like glycosyltransferase
MNKYCAIIVTYGNGFHLLKKVIDSCLKNNFDKIIIVDNNIMTPEKRTNFQEIFIPMC